VRVRLVGLAVAWLVLGAGCGNDERDSVERYIEQVNAIQADLREPLSSVAQVNVEFSTKDANLDKLKPRLARSEGTLRRLHARVAKLAPPAEAEKLQESFLALVDAEADLAGEVSAMASFLPELQTALEPVGPASRRLRKRLTGATTPAAQAEELDRYRAGLELAVTRLDALEPPRVLVPARDTQLRTLKRVRASAAGLARALRADDREALPKLIAAFANAGRSGESVSAQKAQIAAIRAYNSRVAHIRDLADKVANARIELEESVR
jgi:hypothetical protein